MDNAAFIAANEYPYSIWSDLDRDLALYYGAATSAMQSMPSRVTVLLDPDGKWVLKYDVPFFAEKAHPGEVLEDLEILLGL